MTDRSSKPRTSKATPDEVVRVLVSLRRQRMTIRTIADIAGVSVSTAARVCRRHGLSRLERIDPPPPVRRYQKEWPGELIHIDVKKLGRFDNIGHRITRDRSIGSKHLGWEFLHVAVDDASRVTYAELLSDERKTTVAGFLSRLVGWFRKHGVSVTAIMTDNAPSYLSLVFAAVCRSLNIRHFRTRPYTPRTNGKVERMIQTLLREWAYRFAYTTSNERGRWLTRYLHFYNFHRRHSALAYNPPVSRLDRKNVLRRNS